MKKATIVEDAIAHIKTLQQTVDHLKDQLSDVDASSEDSNEPRNGGIHAAEEMKSLGIEVQSTRFTRLLSICSLFDNSVF